MKRLLGRIINSALRPFDMKLLPGWEIQALKVNNPRLDMFLRLAKRGFKPTHVVDVGANKGRWSLDAHRVFPECSFTLVEPLIEMKPYLDRACQELRRAKWVMAGAGEENGSLEFTVQPLLYAASSFCVPAAQAKERGLERRSVPVVTVDSLCEQSEYPTPEVVKIDAEGLDLAVMRGARKLIGVAELFFLEAPLVEGTSDQTFHSIVEFMKTNGYEPYDFTEFVRDPGDGTLGAVEIAFARRDGFLRSSYRSSW